MFYSGVEWIVNGIIIIAGLSVMWFVTLHPQLLIFLLPLWLIRNRQIIPPRQMMALNLAP